MDDARYASCQAKEVEPWFAAIGVLTGIDSGIGIGVKTPNPAMGMIGFRLFGAVAGDFGAQSDHGLEYGFELAWGEGGDWMGYQQRLQEYWRSPEFRWRNAWLVGAGLFFAIATSALVAFFYASGRLEVPAGSTTSILILRSVGWLFGYSAVVVVVLVLFNAFATPAIRRGNPNNA